MISAEDYSVAQNSVPRNPSQTGNQMKYLVPPIVIPALLLVGVVAYGMLKPLIIVGHPAVPLAHSLPR
jgi:hypothetical protein